MSCHGRPAVGKSDEHSVQTGGPGFEARLAKHRYVQQWHLVHVNSVVGAMAPSSQSKLYIWGNKSGGAIPSVADQNYDDMSPDHP